MAQTQNKKAAAAGKGEVDKSKLKPIHNMSTGSPSKGELNRGQGTTSAKRVVSPKNVQEARKINKTRDEYGRVPLKTYKEPKKSTAKSTTKKTKLKKLKTYK